MRWLLGHGVTITGLQLDMAIAAYLIDPADVRYALADLLRRYTPFQLPADRRGVVGAARLHRGRRRRSTRRRSRRAGRRPPVVGAAIGARQAGHGRAVRDDREPARRRARRDGARRHRRRRRRAAATQRATDGGERAARRPSCNASSAGRSTSTRRCSCARSCTPRSSWRRRRRPRPGYSTDAATLEKLRDEWPEFIDPLLQYREVEKLRGTYGDGSARRGRTRRPHPRHVQPDRGPHRPAQQRPAEPAQHPGAQRRGPPVPQGVRARARARSCSSPTTTRSSCAASPTSPPIRV